MRDLIVTPEPSHRHVVSRTLQELIYQLTA
jgi:hypothetical protein